MRKDLPLPKYFLDTDFAVSVIQWCELFFVSPTLLKFTYSWWWVHCSTLFRNHREVSLFIKRENSLNSIVINRLALRLSIVLHINRVFLAQAIFILKFETTSAFFEGAINFQEYQNKRPLKKYVTRKGVARPGSRKKGVTLGRKGCIQKGDITRWNIFSVHFSCNFSFPRIWWVFNIKVLILLQYGQLPILLAK